jgi:hypothetical protein
MAASRIHPWKLFSDTGVTPNLTAVEVIAKALLTSACTKISPQNIEYTSDIVSYVLMITVQLVRSALDEGNKPESAHTPKSYNSLGLEGLYNQWWAPVPA